MITYELALKLKEAGYPFQKYPVNSEDSSGKIEEHFVCFPELIQFKSIYTGETKEKEVGVWYYLPYLAELIEETYGLQKVRELEEEYVKKWINIFGHNT